MCTDRRNRYDEGCIAAHALEVLGDRWALLIIRELMLGPKRFGLLRAGLPGISASVLSRRLEELTDAGVLVRRAVASPVAAQTYELTEAGLAARPVIEALCRWGARHPAHDPRRYISPTALMLSMAAMIDRGRAGALTLVAGFRLPGECFAATLGAGAYDVVRGEVPTAAISFEGTANALAAAIYGPATLAENIGCGQIGFDGDIALGQTFLDLFSLGPAAVRPRDRVSLTDG